jgi:metallo-beta-lactamase class B
MSAVFLWLLVLVQGAGTFHADAPIVCNQCSQWNRDREPFRVFGNTYYVGVEGLSAVLITSSEGHILIDGGLPQSAPLIDAHIRRLGFRTSDIRLILTSHEHYDHVGGIAALQRASSATVVASPSGARALREGATPRNDPQASVALKFPPVRNVRMVKDGERSRVGKLDITAHFTPGHTTGSTSWTWRSCEGSRCLSMVYADSLNAVSAAGFRFTPAADKFRKSIHTIERLPCDILISVHPDFSSLFMDVEKRAKGKPDALINPGACKEYAAKSLQILEKRLLEERK